jgi:hypothetical protein
MDGYVTYYDLTYFIINSELKENNKELFDKLIILIRLDNCLKSFKLKKMELLKTKCRISFIKLNGIKEIEKELDEIMKQIENFNGKSNDE